MAKPSSDDLDLDALMLRVRDTAIRPVVVRPPAEAGVR
jgi:hypothetical protein